MEVGPLWLVRRWSTAGSLHNAQVNRACSGYGSDALFLKPSSHILFRIDPIRRISIPYYHEQKSFGRAYCSCD